MNFLKRLPAVLLSASVLVSACTQIIPGLNVSEDSSSGHEYYIVPANDGSNQFVPAKHSPTAYTVVKITPPLVSELVLGESDAIKTADNELPPLNPTAAPIEYQVGPGDVLFVNIWDHPELTVIGTGGTHDFVSEGHLVRADGTIFFPIAGDVPVTGKTSAEIAAEIAKRIKGTVRDPQVEVHVSSFRSRRVQVSGNVFKPGTVSLDDTAKGIVQAIGESGGLTPLASRRRVLLTRAGRTYSIDAAGTPLAGVLSTTNVALLPGDEIYVPDQSGDQIFVLGAVAHAQPISIPQDSVSLIQALTDAGGLDSLRASGSGVLVFRLSRQSGDDIAKVYTLDMSTAEGMLLASEFPLKPRDVVYVKATAFAQYNSVVQEILPTAQTIFDIIESRYLATSASR